MQFCCAYLLIDHTRTFRLSFFDCDIWLACSLVPHLIFLVSGDCGGEKLCQRVLLLELVAELLSLVCEKHNKKGAVHLSELMHHLLDPLKSNQGDPHRHQGVDLRASGLCGCSTEPPL